MGKRDHFVATGSVSAEEVDAFLDACDRLRFHHVAIDMPNVHAATRQQGLKEKGGAYPYGLVKGAQENAEKLAMRHVYAWYREHFPHTSFTEDKDRLKGFLARQAAKVGEAAIDKRQEMVQALRERYANAKDQRDLARALAVTLAYRTVLPLCLTEEMSDELYESGIFLPPHSLVPSARPDTATELRPIVEEAMAAEGQDPTTMEGRQHFAAEWSRDHWLEWRAMHAYTYPFREKYRDLVHFDLPDGPEDARRWAYETHPILVLLMADPPSPLLLADIIRLERGARYHDRTRGQWIEALVKKALKPIETLNADLLTRLSAKTKTDIDYGDLKPLLMVAASALTDDQDDALNPILDVCYRELDRPDLTDYADYALLVFGVLLLFASIPASVPTILVALADAGVAIAGVGNAVTKYYKTVHNSEKVATEDIFAELSDTIRLIEAREFSDPGMLGLFVELLGAFSAQAGLYYAARAMRGEARLLATTAAGRPSAQQVLPDLPPSVDKKKHAMRTSLPKEAAAVGPAPHRSATPDAIDRTRGKLPESRMTDSEATSVSGTTTVDAQTAMSEMRENPLTRSQVDAAIAEIEAREAVRRAGVEQPASGTGSGPASEAVQTRATRVPGTGFTPTQTERLGPQGEAAGGQGALAGLAKMKTEGAERAAARRAEEAAASRSARNQQAAEGQEATLPLPVKERVLTEDDIAVREMELAEYQVPQADAATQTARTTADPIAADPPVVTRIRDANSLSEPADMVAAAQQSRNPARLGQVNAPIGEAAPVLQARAKRVSAARAQADEAADALGIHARPSREYAEVRVLNDEIILRNARRKEFVLDGRITWLDGLPPDLVSLVQRGARFRVSRSGNLLYHLPGETERFTHVFDALRNTRSRRVLFGYSNAKRTSQWYYDLRFYWESRRLARESNLGWEFYDIEMKVWIPENHMDMGHIVSAVEHNQLMMRWAEKLRGTIPENEIQRRIARCVKAFMDDFTNYIPQFRWRNQRLAAPRELTYGVTNIEHNWGAPGKVGSFGQDSVFQPRISGESPDRMVEEAFSIYNELIRLGEIRVSQ